MGYITSGTTLQLVARLTPIGKRKILLNGNNTITSFSLGDSDTNYLTTIPLPAGNTASIAGGIGSDLSVSNGTTGNANIRSYLTVNSTGSIKKNIESQSLSINESITSIPSVQLSGGSLQQNVVSKTDMTNGLVNLFYTCGLPITQSQISAYTSITQAKGGYSDTALSGLSASNVLIISIGQSNYGELIDGKSMKVSVTNVNDTYELYGTYENKGKSDSIEDATYVETSTAIKNIGNNIVFLFCDKIQKPNNDSTLSWATGFGSYKPYSSANKEFFNMVTDSSLSQNADKAVGFAILDKGIIVITEPYIVDNFYPLSNSNDTVVTLKSTSTMICQNIICIANRGEFSTSLNTTFNDGDIPRFTEIGLYDAAGDLIAISKTDRPVIKNINDFMALSIKITI